MPDTPERHASEAEPPAASDTAVQGESQKREPDLQAASEATVSNANQSAATEHSAPSENTHRQHRIRHIWRHGFMGLLLAALLIVLRFPIEHTVAGDQTRLAAYRLIQYRLASHSVRHSNSVVVVNIANIPNVDDASVAPGGAATSRKSLLQCLANIAKGGATAIGVDIDLSPDENGNPITLDDPRFLKDCLDLERTYPVKIYLGVYRHAANPAPSSWLGGDNWVPMAAGIAIGNNRFQTSAAHARIGIDEVLRMFCWTRVEGAATRLRSLAAALAERSDHPLHELPPALNWAAELRVEHSPSPEFETEGFLVDYGTLESLVHAQIPWERVSSASTKGAFQGKIVVVGDVGNQNQTPQELFRVPGRSTPFPGALLHACAVNTLLSAPLYELTFLGRVAVDVLLAAMILSVLMVFKYRNLERGAEEAEYEPHWPITFMVAILALFIGIVCVHLTRVMWDDFPFVIAGILVHKPFELLVLRVWKRGLGVNSEKAGAD